MRPARAKAEVQRQFTACRPHCATEPSPVCAMPRRHGPARWPRFLLLSAVACVLTTSLLPLPTLAQEREERPHARLPESVRRIERETGGKVLQVRPIQRGDREIYRMKVLTPDGRVKIVQDDPKRPREREREPTPVRPESGGREPPRGADDDPPTVPLEP